MPLRLGRGAVWRQTAVWLGVVGILVFIATSHTQTALRVLQTLRQGHPLWIGVAVLLQGVFFVLQAALWKTCLDAAGVRSRVFSLLPVWFASLFVSAVLPTAGPGVFLLDAHRRGESIARTTAAALLVRVADFASLLPLVLSALFFLRARNELHPYQLGAAFVFVLLTLAWAAPLYLANRYPARWERFINNIVCRVNTLLQRLQKGASWSSQAGHDFTQSAAHLSHSPARLFLPFVTGITAHLIDIASLGALCRAFGQSVSAGATVCAFAVAVLFWVVGITPQGVGVVEGAMAGAFSALGMPLAPALAISLAFRGLTLYLPLLIGVFFARRFFAPSARLSPAVVSASSL